MPPAPDAPTPPKLFPRNLTARADYVVRGNPASSRTESGVDNCYPGLELDQRNLDRSFLPGLDFEFHRPSGAVLVAVAQASAAAEAGLKAGDLPLWLWALLGPPPDDPARDLAVFLRDRNGLEAWRQVHDLSPGRILALVGPGPAADAPAFDPGLDRQLRDIRDQGQSIVQRSEDDTVELAVLVSERARYLDENGVIEPEVYGAGELTRSLCAPWQYDFRDCGCFYWAATKPDLVTSGDGGARFLNFQRRDRTSAPPEEDSAGNSTERREKELDYAELIAGAWNDDLAVVIGGREESRFVPPPEPSIELMSRQQVIDELRYLATVEHALCVEYLYAHYSLDAPMVLTGDAAPRTRRVFAAAREVFDIAVDEMRHFRWVNDALSMLGQDLSVGRAETIGRDLNRPFALEALTPQQLQWFIDVERPSQDLTGALDGMYVRLHTSIDRQPELFPERERLVHLVKLIIDEGADHFERFSSVQGHLADLDPDEYLRPMADPTEPRLVSVQALSDQNYGVVIGALQLTFSLGDRAGGLVLEQARRSMFNLHEVNHFLAAEGSRPAFRLPASAPVPVRLEATDAHALIESLDDAVSSAVSAVGAEGGERESGLAGRLQQRSVDLFARIHAVIDEDGE